MILGPITYIDCLIFLAFLAVQLISQAGLFTTVYYLVQSLPFLFLRLPFAVLRDRYLIWWERSTPYFQHITVFQDVVLRCMKYAFSELPPNIVRVVFTKEVALPFIRFRMWRHGYWFHHLQWEEVSQGGVNGLWIAQQQCLKPDITIYYCHGGGFSMGSSYFYLEFLLPWLDVLKGAGYKNPAIFALEYSLAPDRVFPAQLQEAIAGYQFVLSRVDDSSRICLSGDSAGGTLILGLLLHHGNVEEWKNNRPRLAALISPWVTIASRASCNTRSDFLNAESLRSYAQAYTGDTTTIYDPIASPGMCNDDSWWLRASPTEGFVCVYGSEEAIGPEIRRWVQMVRKAGCTCETWEEQDAVHVWPVVALFTCNLQSDRLKGLVQITNLIRQKMR